MLLQLNMCRESIVASRQKQSRKWERICLTRDNELYERSFLVLVWPLFLYYSGSGKVPIIFSSKTLWLIPFIFLLPRSASPQLINHLCGQCQVLFVFCLLDSGVFCFIKVKACFLENPAVGFEII